MAMHRCCAISARRCARAGSRPSSAPSGSGKSTLFALLTRLHATQQGQITIDGTTIAEYSGEAFSRSVAVVRQDPFLFHLSVYENLALIDPDRNRIMEACKKVRLHDFIENLPQGYDTVLDEDAADLSGGQKQRLVIARALLRWAKILLCDELTSSMDEKLSAEIFDILEEIRPGHTIVLITHKMAEQARADDVIDLGA